MTKIRKSLLTQRLKSVARDQTKGEFREGLSTTAVGLVGIGMSVASGNVLLGALSGGAVIAGMDMLRSASAKVTSAVVRGHAIEDLRMRGRGFGMREQLMGAPGGKAYLNSAAQKKAESAPPPTAPRATMPGRPSIGGDGRISYTTLDGRTVQATKAQAARWQQSRK